MSNISIIKWGHRYTETYTYGSEIILNKSSVYFSSPMMPVGAKIKSWHSKGSYSLNRVSPLLPLLIGGKDYELALFLEKNERNSFQVTIEFFDEFDNEISTEYFNDLRVAFTYPLAAVSYQINLVNKKHERIQFYFLTISEMSAIELSEVAVNEDFSIMDFASAHSKNELKVVIDTLVRETTVINDLDAEKENFYIFLNSHDQTSFVKSIVAVVKSLEHHAQDIRIIQGEHFEQLSTREQLFPDILTTLYSEVEREIFTDVPISNLGCDERDIQKILEDIKEILAADGVVLSVK